MTYTNVRVKRPIVTLKSNFVRIRLLSHVMMTFLVNSLLFIQNQQPNIHYGQTKSLVNINGKISLRSFQLKTAKTKCSCCIQISVGQNSYQFVIHE